MTANELEKLILQESQRLPKPESEFLAAIRIQPEIWRLRNSAGEESGVWVFAIVGKKLICFDSDQETFFRAQSISQGIIEPLETAPEELASIVAQVIVPAAPQGLENCADESKNLYGADRLEEFPIVAKFTLDKAYLAENYANWAEFQLVKRKWLQRAGVGVVGLAILFLIFHQDRVAWALCLFACIVFLEGYWARRTWIRERLGARVSWDPDPVELYFNHEGFYSKGPVYQGFMKWDGMSGRFVCTRGLYLFYGDGHSIYVPQGAFIKSSLEDLIELIQEVEGSG